MTVTAPQSTRSGIPTIPLVKIELDRDLDITTLHMLFGQITEALSVRPEILAIDFSDCRYIDAQAIRVLLDAHKLAWQQGSRLLLRNCHPDTIRLLAMAGVLRVFDIEPAREVRT